MYWIRKRILLTPLPLTEMLEYAVYILYRACISMMLAIATSRMWHVAQKCCQILMIIAILASFLNLHEHCFQVFTPEYCFSHDGVNSHFGHQMSPDEHLRKLNMLIYLGLSYIRHLLSDHMCIFTKACSTKSENMRFR